jgi:DNA-binding response OmpR family regulator
MRVLVVDDEPAVRQALERALRFEGYAAELAEDGTAGLAAHAQRPADAIVLDIAMPRLDGLEMCRRLRAAGDRTPVLMLTAKSSVTDRVDGLDAGADDYLVKPFAFPELLARVRVLLRRGKPAAGGRLVLADLEMDLAERLVVRGGQKVELTAREFELLEYLFANSGHVVSREMLARDVWRETARQTPIDNVIDAQMVRLRRKIDGPWESKLLHTVRGVGFVLREGEES